MPLLTYAEWAKRGHPMIKLTYHRHEFVCLYLQNAEDEDSLRIQTNVAWVGDSLDLRPIKYFKGEDAMSIAEELGLFKAESKAKSGGKSKVGKDHGESVEIDDKVPTGPIDTAELARGLNDGTYRNVDDYHKAQAAKVKPKKKAKR